MDAAVTHQLSRGICGYRVVTASYFLAMKLEAFRGRGTGDFFRSHNVEDLNFVIGGRSTIAEEVQTETPSLRRYFRTEVTDFLAIPGFMDTTRPEGPMEQLYEESTGEDS